MLFNTFSSILPSLVSFSEFCARKSSTIANYSWWLVFWLIGFLWSYLIFSLTMRHWATLSFHEKLRAISILTLICSLFSIWQPSRQQVWLDQLRANYQTGAQTGRTYGISPVCFLRTFQWATSQWEPGPDATGVLSLNWLVFGPSGFSLSLPF